MSWHRKAGSGEKAVMVLSSVIVALLAAQNILGGQNPLATTDRVKRG